MKSVYTYSDYRAYLHDWYLHKKEQQPSFSYRIIASRVGFKSAGFFSLILQSKTNISMEMALRFADCIKLRAREREYFQTMVRYNQSSTPAERKTFFEQMQQFKESSVRIVEPSLYEYYSRWYHSVIRALLEIIPVTGDGAELAGILVPPIKPAEAVKSIELMTSLGIISRNAQGQLKPTDTILSTGYEATTLAIRNYLLATLELSTRAVDAIPREERNLSCLTLGLSVKGFKTLQEELREFRRRMMNLAAKDDADRVYNLCIQLFPVSKGATRTKGRS